MQEEQLEKIAWTNLCRNKIIYAQEDPICYQK